MLLAAIESDQSKDTVTDEDIDAIAVRWRQMGYLRDLYLDDILFKEFELFRALSAAKLPDQIRRVIVEPGLTKSSTSASPERSRQYSTDFKARFYKSLCVHSMAIAALQLTKIAPDSNKYPVRSLYESLADDAMNLWTKRKISLGSRTITAGWEVKLDCLEMFDFLYLFLLRKLVPFESFNSWTDGCSGQDVAVAYPDRTAVWYSVLETFRRHLKPHDIFELIKHRVWRADTTFPWSKTTYMRLRGMFHLQSIPIQSPEYYYMCNRSDMVNQLLPKGYEQHTQTDQPCWWDRMRVACGSPFLPGAVPRYVAEVAEYQKKQDLRASELTAGPGDSQNGENRTDGRDDHDLRYGLGVFV